MSKRRAPDFFTGGQADAFGVPPIALLTQRHPENRFAIVPGFPCYAIGDDGSVWCCRGRNGKRLGYWKRMSLVTLPPRRDHLHVGLRRTGERQHLIHVGVIVLTAFVGPRPSEEMQCCHGDGNGLNNRLTNLRWGTPKANGEDKVRHGVAASGERHGMAKLTAEDVQTIRRRCQAGEAQKAVGADYNLHQSHVSKIMRGEIWSSPARKTA